MAIINYPQTNPNFWGRGVQDRSASIIAQGKMLNHRKQVEMFGALRDVMKELDPQSLMADSFRVLQARKIQGIENYVTDLMKTKGRRKDLSPKDLMGIQWEVEKYNAWQADAVASQNQFKQAYEVYEKAPDGYYKPDHFLAGMNEFMSKGKHPVGGYLAKAPEDYYGAASKLKPFDKNGFTQKVEGTQVINGRLMDTRSTRVDYGVYKYDGDGGIEGIDPEATKAEKDKVLMGLLMSNPGYQVAAQEDFASLEFTDPDLMQFYIDQSNEYKDNAAAQSYLDQVEGKEINYPPEVNPAYLYARDKARDLVQPSGAGSKEILNLPATVRSKMMGGSEDPKEQQTPGKYLDEKGDYLKESVTDRNGFTGMVAAGKGRGGKGRNVRDAAENYGAEALILSNSAPKNKTYTIDDNTTFISMPEGDGWNINYLGNNARVWSDKVGKPFNVKSYSVHEDMPVYIGAATYDDIPAYKYENGEWVKDRRGRKYVISPNTPLSKEMAYSVAQAHGSEWDQVKDMDVAKIDIVSGAQGGKSSFSIATVFDGKVMGELGISLAGDDGEPVKVSPSKQESKDIVLEDHTYVGNGVEMSYDSLEQKLVLNQGMSKSDAQEKIREWIASGKLTVQ